MHKYIGSVAAAVCLAAAAPAFAADVCSHLDALYPQLGRTGTGDNAYRPLPLFSPLRPQAGAPGTISLSIDVDHVSTAPKGKPGIIYVGNYPVTDIPAFRLIGGASGPAQIVNPVTGQMVPIENACIASPSWGYGGSQWALIQGDTLDIMFQSRLDYEGNQSVPRPVNGGEPCRASNLHTHGLLVSPYHPLRAGTGPYGDYVLDDTQPRGSSDFGSSQDNCGTKLQTIEHRGHGLTDLPLHYVTTIPGTPGVSSLVSGQHPSGLFWYHPHPHGYAQFQQHGGTTGVITVGNLTDYACPEGDGSPGNCTLTDTNIRVMAIKDQGIQGPVDGVYNSIHDIESDLCTPTGGVRRGECQGSDAIPDSKWVFTINGVQYPIMHAGAGRTEIWRLVNASPSMTYLLTIVPAGRKGALPFQVLAKDGVGVRQEHGNALMQTQLLMTPATRVEIAIPAPAQGGGYILRNISVSTAADGNNSGNVWPAVDLGEVLWPKQDSAAADLPAAPPLIVAGMKTPIPHSVTNTSQIPVRCRYESTDTRVIYYVHRFVHVFGAPGGGGQSGITPTLNEVFGLIAGLRHADGTMDFYPDKDGKPLHTIEGVWKDGIHGSDPAFPGFGHNAYNDVCTVQGNVEHWELQNWTAEDHNFHMHQTKFTIDPSGTFQFPEPRPGDVPALHSMDVALRDFVTLHHPTYNDTIPVPRGQSICNTAPTTLGCHNNTATQCPGAPGDPACGRPGIMSLLIDFSRQEQVGTFVYHCHILEHEDGGMMAPITVLCPPGSALCAAQQAASAPICKPADSAGD